VTLAGLIYLILVWQDDFGSVQRRTERTAENSRRRYKPGILLLYGEKKYLQVQTISMQGLDALYQNCAVEGEAHSKSCGSDQPWIHV
jgi:hypothetical protein